ncbi:hypothetical protein BDR03DRAFT_868590, partial [Suillus americanus]
EKGYFMYTTVSREWTRVHMHGPAPAGRYGHVVTMVGVKFFVLGSQANGEFLNDLWSFDLNTLRTTPAWEQCQPVGAACPAQRTGHACVTYQDRIIVFGGTDGKYNYNDTWSYDTNTETWSEPQCIGLIPAPREGHAAAVIDDVVYIFGGRGIDGKELDDLAAFKMSNQRWYMLQNMGPAPSGHSGHAMASMGWNTVSVSFTAPQFSNAHVGSVHSKSVVHGDLTGVCTATHKIRLTHVQIMPTAGHALLILVSPLSSWGSSVPRTLRAPSMGMSDG